MIRAWGLVALLAAGSLILVALPEESEGAPPWMGNGGGNNIYIGINIGGNACGGGAPMGGNPMVPQNGGVQPIQPVVGGANPQNNGQTPQAGGGLAGQSKGKGKGKGSDQGKGKGGQTQAKGKGGSQGPTQAKGKGSHGAGGAAGGIGARGGQKGPVGVGPVPQMGFQGGGLVGVRGGKK